MPLILDKIPAPYRKIATGALIAAATGGITYLLAAFDQIDVTPGAPLAVAIAGTILNALRVALQAAAIKYATSNGNGNNTPTKPATGITP